MESTEWKGTITDVIKFSAGIQVGVAKTRFRTRDSQLVDSGFSEDHFSKFKTPSPGMLRPAQLRDPA